MLIRPERPEEFDLIFELVKTAFETAQVADGDEPDFVNKLRASGNYLPELALVAEENGELVGHIMLTRCDIVDGGRRTGALLLAPLAVKLEYRNRGVGGDLLKAAVAKAAQLGYPAVLLVGNPAYYLRFGFRSASEFGIRPTHEIPAENVMARELFPGALAGVSGTAECF